VLTRTDQDLYLYTAKIHVHLVLLNQITTASVSAAMTKMVGPKFETDSSACDAGQAGNYKYVMLVRFVLVIMPIQGRFSVPPQEKVIFI